MKKKAISAIVKGIQKVSSGTKTTAKTKNVRSKTGLNKKAVSREGFDPAKAAAAKAKGVKVHQLRNP